jgi:hypothetical protein
VEAANEDDGSIEIPSTAEIPQEQEGDTDDLSTTEEAQATEWDWVLPAVPAPPFLNTTGTEESPDSGVFNLRDIVGAMQ